MKIKLRRPKPGQGFGGTSGGEQVSVVEWDESYSLPQGAEKVADNTPLSDWHDEKDAKEAKGAAGAAKEN